MTGRPVHPVADLFPMLGADELAELAEDIKQRGLLHPVVLDRAMTQHTRQWLDIQNIAKAKHDAAHAAKTLHGYKLLAIQEEHKCSMWKAEQLLRGGAP